MSHAPCYWNQRFRAERMTGMHAVSRHGTANTPSGRWPARQRQPCQVSCRCRLRPLHETETRRVRTHMGRNRSLAISSGLGGSSLPPCSAQERLPGSVRRTSDGGRPRTSHSIRVASRARPQLDLPSRKDTSGGSQASGHEHGESGHDQNRPLARPVRIGGWSEDRYRNATLFGLVSSRNLRNSAKP